MTLKIALIGYGAIARALCKALEGDREISITQIIVRPAKFADLAQGLPADVRAISSLDDLANDCGFVLECAGHEAVRQFGPAVLKSGVDFGVVSVGALADEETLQNLEVTARETDSRVVVVPGAIGGIDALSAAGSALDTVTYTSCKAPKSWLGSPAEKTHDLSRIDSVTVLFSGTAREAALTYPKNANVVATVALAGTGFDRTCVTLTADPAATGNTHHIKATGSGYDLDYTTQGPPLPENPRTSALTALSILRTLQHRGSGLIV